MPMDRTLLYIGVFISAIGVALAAVELGPVGTSGLVGVLRLWPLALIAIGAAVALRRTSLGLLSGLLAAAVPGLLLGSAFALAPRYALERGVWDEFRTVYERPGLPHVGPDIDFGDVPFDQIGGPR